MAAARTRAAAEIAALEGENKALKDNEKTWTLAMKAKVKANQSLAGRKRVNPLDEPEEGALILTDAALPSLFAVNLQYYSYSLVYSLFNICNIMVYTL